MQQYQSHWLIFSNLTWLVPASYAYQAGSILLALPSLVVMICSMMYHWNPSRVREYLDTGFAVVYLGVGPFLLYAAAFQKLLLVVCCVVVSLAAATWVYARVCDTRNNALAYQRWHGVWHILAALMTLTIYMYFFNGTNTS